MTIARWECVSPVDPPLGSTIMNRCVGCMLLFRFAMGGRATNDSSASLSNTEFWSVTAMPSDSRWRVSALSTPS